MLTWCSETGIYLPLWSINNRHFYLGQKHNLRRISGRLGPLQINKSVKLVEKYMALLSLWDKLYNNKDWTIENNSCKPEILMAQTKWQSAILHYCIYWCVVVYSGMPRAFCCLLSLFCCLLSDDSVWLYRIQWISWILHRRAMQHLFDLFVNGNLKKGPWFRYFKILKNKYRHENQGSYGSFCTPDQFRRASGRG